ncbi:MAG TPA: SPFH domain-containing protein [Candidatus Limivivens intestinipullorum]|uniref:SPFH domain-containing protein n=1 Tax=Candidatus Limivivens intestinipullorum TaxID=2840858 RepID=A0A9D1JLY1_9FIRM|nr:SPFH domain-containing protein [Candidatus Limivivens intestinipullorum]
MGIIKAAVNAVGGAVSDQWLRAIEPDGMDDQTVFVKGVNPEGKDVIANGSVIHVYDNQFMLLVDGGKIIDYTAEPGYFKVDNSSMPSLFSGTFQDLLNDTFERFKFGGGTPQNQQVYYINLQEIKGIRFGTRNPVNYFDSFYNAELFLRAHGTYSIKVTDPLKFYAEAVPRNRSRVGIDDINEQYLSEFLDALQSSINQMSADGIRISYVASKSRELSRYMADALDEDWRQTRGMEIQSVGLASISYDEESQKLINMRNKGAMMADPSIREGYVQASVARGLESAGSNAAGSMAGFMGMGMGMQAGGGFMGAASAANMEQMKLQHESAAKTEPSRKGVVWRCACGHENTGNFCSECGKPRPRPGVWRCECGHENTGKFCSECGRPRPAGTWRCECGHENTGKFCAECGKPRPQGR